MTRAQKLAQSLAEVGITDKGFLIDTSRNGRPGIRSRWGSWCNVKGAGLGPRPQASPAPLVDAFCWVKPPGESDGTSDPSAARYDATCASPDSAPRAPEAGTWFESYFADLVANADPPLERISGWVCLTARSFTMSLAWWKSTRTVALRCTAGRKTFTTRGTSIRSGFWTTPKLTRRDKRYPPKKHLRQSRAPVLFSPWEQPAPARSMQFCPPQTRGPRCAPPERAV